MELSIILAIVLFHELGHFLFARLFHWRIHSIMLWVFGGVMKTEEHGNKPIHEDALVTIAGPLQHIIIYVGLFVLSTNNVLRVPVRHYSCCLQIMSYRNPFMIWFYIIIRRS